MKTIHPPIICFATTFLLGGAASAVDEPLFNGSLVKGVLVATSDLDKNTERRGGTRRTPQVQDPEIEITKVYWGDKSAERQRVVVTPHGTIRKQNADDFTTLGYDDGLLPKRDATIGTKVITFLIRVEDYAPPPTDPLGRILNHPPAEHYFLNPRGSIFYRSFASTCWEFISRPQQYQMQKGWAEMAHEISGLRDRDRLERLKQHVSHENFIIGVQAIHWLARLHGQEGLDVVMSMVPEPGLKPEIRLAIDHELCLRIGRGWLEDERRQPLMEFLKFGPERSTYDGTDYLRFQQTQLETGVWFGERRE